MTMTYKEDLLRIFSEYKYSKDEIEIYLMQIYRDAITNQDSPRASVIEEMMESLGIDNKEKQKEQPTK